MCKSNIVGKMKKIVHLFSVLLVLSFLSSCDKQMADEPDVSLKVAYVDYYTTPVSFNQVVPAVLAVDKPRGGNVTCTDVEQAFGGSYICGNKIDFTNEAEFEAAFPSWLNVQVDGIYVSFSIDGCGEIDGVPVKVGAVIVKGSNSASVYYYPEGSTGDSHLAAPGDKYMVSNLTFCFVECEEPEEFVVAVKAFFWPGPEIWNNPTWVTSSGAMIFTPVLPWEWCSQLGVNYYPSTSTFNLLSPFSLINVGTVTLQDAYIDGVHSLIVTLTYLEGYTVDKTYLYIGSEEDLKASILSTGCPDYTSWMFKDEPNNSNVQIIIVPL